MDEVKNFAQNASPELSPKSVLTSLGDDQTSISTPIPLDDDNVETYSPEAAPIALPDNEESYALKDVTIAFPGTSSITLDDNDELYAPEEAPVAHPDTSASIITLDEDEELCSPRYASMDSQIDHTLIESNYPPISIQVNMEEPTPQPNLSDNHSPQDYGIHQLLRPDDTTDPQLVDEHSVESTSQQDEEDSDITTTPNSEESSEAKIFAMPTLDDDFISSSSAQHKRSDSVDHIVAKVPPNYFFRTQSSKPFRAVKSIDLTKVQIDTTAPFESVKEAVSMFGGVADWKAHRVQTIGRRKLIEQELGKVQEEIESYKQQLEVAEEAKKLVLQELNATEACIEQLKLSLETMAREEEQAKQAAILTKLRIDEIELEIADGCSSTGKAQLEHAQAKDAAAEEELHVATDELGQTRKEYDTLLAEKDESVKRAEEAEKSIEELTAELLNLKEYLEAAHSAHLAAVDDRIEEVVAKELEFVVWEKEALQAKDESEKLNKEMLSTKEVRARLRKATALLQDKKAQMKAYMESESINEVKLEDIIMEPKKSSHKDVETALTSAKKELTEVEESIEKAADEVNTLKASAASLKSELDKEKCGLADAQIRERTALIAVRSLESELNSFKSEMTVVQMKMAGEKDETVDLTKWLQQAAQEADQAKTLAQTAHTELQKAKEETEEAKAGASAMESRLNEAQKEIEDAKGSEKLALAAIDMLARSNSFRRDGNVDQDTTEEVTIPLEEFYELTKKVHEAEETAKQKVAAAVSQVEAAKEAESRSLNRLEEVTREIARQKEALKDALQKAEKAEEGKLAVEQELRKWKNEQKHNDVEPARAPLSVPVLKPVDPVPLPVVVSALQIRNKTLRPSLELSKSFFNPTCGLRLRSSKRALAGSKTVTETELSTDTRIVPKKKKKSFFPRFLTFLFKSKFPSSTKTA